MGTTTIWGMNNSQQIILRGYFTTQTHEYMIINIQAIRIESHKQPLQII